MVTKYVDVREYRHKNNKLWIWLIWLLAMIVSALYCVVSVFSFQNIVQVYKSKDGVADHQLWAFLVATILPPAMTIGFFVFGTVILACSTIAESGLTYSFGCLHMSCLWLATLVLHSAVSIHAYRDRMKSWQTANNIDAVDNWDKGKTTLAQVAYIMAYFLTCVYLAMWILIFWFRDAVSTFMVDPKVAAAQRKEEEEAEKEEAENAAVSAPEPAKTEPLKKPEDGKADVDEVKDKESAPADASDVKVDTKDGESGTTSFSWWSRKKTENSDAKV